MSAVTDFMAAITTPDPNDPVMQALDAKLLDASGRVVVRPAHELAQIPTGDLRAWCHWRAVYLLPSLELVCWLRDKIAGRKAIEIAAGHGAVGRALGIPTTDSRMQERDDIRALYTLQGQPVIRYHDDIERLDAQEVIEKYKPEVVVGCWVTHVYDAMEHFRGGNFLGVDEDKIVDAATYIHVGSDEIHLHKKILARPHESIAFPWLYGRGKQRRIRVWEKTP